MTSFYGNGVTATDKGNLEVRPGNHGKVAYVFMARHGGVARAVRAGWTNRVSPYGRGNGGTYRAGLQSMASGQPAETWLGTPGTKAIPIKSSPASFQVEWPVQGATLVAGQMYAFVMENVDPNPDSNHGSSNNPWVGQSAWRSFDAGGSGQPHFFYADAPAYMMRKGAASGNQWVKDMAYFPAFDVEYEDGRHEGHSAIHPYDVNQIASGVGNLSPTSMGCWSFKAPRAMTAVAVWWFLQKGSGSTEPTVAVVVNGVRKAAGTISGFAAFTPTYPMWFKAALSEPVAIAKGDDVRVEIRTTAGNYYLPACLVRDSSTQGAVPKMMSWPFDERGDPSTHRSLEGLAGGTPAYGAWDYATPYQAVLELSTSATPDPIPDPNPEPEPDPVPPKTRREMVDLVRAAPAGTHTQTWWLDYLRENW